MKVDTQKEYSAEEIYKIANKSIAYIEDDFGNSSGVVISNDGLILTNYHCYSDKLRVVIDKKTYKTVQVVDLFMDVDLIMLKVTAKNLDYLTLAKESKLQIGSTVYTIGTPIDFSLHNTINNGIISGIRKYGVKYLVQTNAIIYGGNSGGALLNSACELIGITNGVKEEAEVGVTFAVHIDYLRKFVKGSIRYNKQNLQYNKFLPNGIAQLNRGEFKLALTSFNKYLKHNQKDRFAYYQRGLLYEKIGYLSEAISDYKQCVKYIRDYDLPYILDAYIALYRLIRSKSAKSKYLNLIMFSNVINDKILLLVGEDKFEKKEYEDAKKIFDMVIRMNPVSSNAYINLAEINFCQGNYKKAKFYLIKAIEYADKDQDFHLYNIASLLYNLNYKINNDVYTEILDYLYSAINLNNTNPSVYFLFCKCYVDLFNYPRAYEFILAATFYDKNNTIINSPEYHYYFGVIIKNLKKDFTYKTYFLEALDLLNNSIPLDGKLTYEQKQEKYNELELSAEIHYEMGEYETSKKEFNDVLKHIPNTNRNRVKYLRNKINNIL